MMDVLYNWSPFLQFTLLERMQEKVSLSQEQPSFHFCHSLKNKADQPAGALSGVSARVAWVKVEANGLWEALFQS